MRRIEDLSDLREGTMRRIEDLSDLRERLLSRDTIPVSLLVLWIRTLCSGIRRPFGAVSAQEC